MNGVTPTAADGRFAHHPVMVAEVLEHLSPAPPGALLDATVGGGGHARAILGARPDFLLIGLDRDPSAVEAAGAALAGLGAVIHSAPFIGLGDVLDSLGISRLSGCLFDLGVSSPQLDNPERGFSYRNEGPLDMRMDRAQQLSAHEIVNRWSTDDLARIIRLHGDERFAGRIADAIAAARPVATTAALSDIVREAIPAPARRRGGHPAKRTFQAIRIAVNGELEQIEPALEAAIDRMSPGGRGAVISYHSGEDRIVKQVLRRRAGLSDEARFRGLPRSPSQSPPAIELVPRGSRRPSPDEADGNPRASSARMRAFCRLDSDQDGEKA